MDEVYVVDLPTKSTHTVERASFSAMGIHERQDLQKWLLAHPQILGEPLCIIASEFSGFDRSSRRLDLLALDTDATLVVIEVKLEVERTFADLQALRYAAFCSAMTMEQVLQEYASFHRITAEEAAKQISEFLGADDELPEPGDRPRILLVAGSMDDPEITSTVLWLRSFDIDIRCLEITPYQIQGEQILLVPRTIIPLPEAEAYQIRVEKKDATRAQKERKTGKYIALLGAIGTEYDKLDSPFQRSLSQGGGYRQVPTGVGGLHYEWQVRRRDKRLDIAIHFEHTDPSRNARLLEVTSSSREQITAGIEESFLIEPEWGKRGWAYATFHLPLQRQAGEGYAQRAAELMAKLIERTWPSLSDVA
jgi:hypothetical protein